jgi:hypothetical protein
MTPEQRDRYAAEYGIDKSEVREDIRSYIQNDIQCSAALSVDDGSTEGVTVR